MVKYIVISDIHLGHKNNPTGNIINNLLNYFEDNHKVFKKLDIIFIAGDIFDKLLVNGSKAFLLAMEWLSTVAMYCNANNIKFRILEGTPGHDWKQASVFATSINKLNIDIDFKYIDTLYIEKIEDLDLTVLYIPDEYKHNAKDTYKEVLALLKANNLKQVDIAIMHGQFHYQLPMVELESSHNEEDYLSIVKYYISIGHIHTHSANGRILAQGSFDRLSHNEEEPKGAMLVIIDKNTDYCEYRFIENKRAAIFKTFNYTTKDDDYIFNRIPKDIKSVKENSHIRLLVNSKSKLNGSSKSLELEYPNYVIKVETKDKKESSMHESKLLEVPSIDSFQITENNIEELLLKEVDKHNLTSVELDITKEEILKVI